MDEDAQSKRLLAALKNAGHDVTSVGEQGANSASDPDVLDLARFLRRVLLTYNCSDFAALHAVDSTHPGILAVHKNPPPTASMSYDAIARAVGSLEASAVPIQHAFHALNDWQ